MSDLGKFKSLPGVALNEPDVYETSDLPEAEQASVVTAQAMFESDQIESRKLDITSAVHSFKGKPVISDSADFSDAINIRKGGYGSASFIEHDPSKETVEEKYHRLQAEVQSLSAVFKDSLKSDTENANVTQVAIEQLQEQLKELQLEQVLGTSYSVVSGSSSADTRTLFAKLDALRQPQKTSAEKTSESSAEQSRTLYDITFSPGSSNILQLAKVSDLEGRLAKLETLIGSDPEEIAKLTSEFQGKGLSNVVSLLAQKLRMLDVNNLDVVEARLSAVVAKLGQLREKKQTSDPETVQKINEMYELTCKWDELCSCLPQIVTRMKAANDLHEQALQFSQALSHLSTVQQQLTKALETDSALLNETRSGMAQNLDIIKANFENLDKRLQSVKK